MSYNVRMREAEERIAFLCRLWTIQYIFLAGMQAEKKRLFALSRDKNVKKRDGYVL